MIVEDDSFRFLLIFFRALLAVLQVSKYVFGFELLIFSFTALLNLLQS